MKTSKRIAIAISIALLVIGTAAAFTACGPTVTGTYTYSMTAEEVKGNVSHGGFLASMAAAQKNTLVLKDDKTYEYTKDVFVPDDNGNPTEGKARLTYKFTGTYTFEKSVVTLALPTDCEFSEYWASMAPAYFNENIKGKASDGDIVQCQPNESHNPLHMFITPYYTDSKKVGDPVVVTVDAESGTFTYNKVESSEDA